LLGSPYRAELLSVHDPDEFIAAAGPDPAAQAARLESVIAAYSQLAVLRASGEVKAIGIGAKDWRVARDVAQRVKLDWVMLACSLTVLRHPRELLDWIAALSGEGVAVIDSALFHGGFLTGGNYFDYRRIEPKDPADRMLLAWRHAYATACARAGVTTAHAAVAFARLVPGVSSVALNTSDPARVGENVAMGMEPVPVALWKDLAGAGLIDSKLEFLP
ncbi:MAG: aldo/keto reductase, partial [Spirochaetota bacterium]